jgi:MFS family permease
MYAQGVRGASAAEAGATLMPMVLCWPIASTLAGLWMVRLGYRVLLLTGTVALLTGGALLAFVRPESPALLLPAAIGVIGVGLGFLSIPLIVAVQAAVPWQRRGVATSSQQFFRTIGGALAVGAFGAMLNADLAQHGVTALTEAALDAPRRAQLSADEVARASLGLADGISRIFLVLAIMAAASIVVAWKFPRGDIAAHVYRPPES